MGTTSNRKKKGGATSALMRSKERANMSFFLVVMFFAVFGVIVLTEVFLMDERNRSTGIVVRRGSASSNHKRPDGQEYDDDLQLDDYLTYRGGGHNAGPNSFDSINNLLKDGILSDNKDGLHQQRLAIAPLQGLPIVQDIEIPNSPGNQPLPFGIEWKLPRISENLTAFDGQWQPVNGTRFKFYVFSAFYDRRKSQRSVRIIGATRTRSPERVWCRLWYPPQVNPANGSHNTQSQSSVTVMAKIKVIRENWNLKYSACFVLCPLAKNITSPPHSVSVVSRLRAAPANRLIVRNTEHDLDNPNATKFSKERLAICVKPLHFNYNQVIQMLEFLELNILLGVEHFTFYNHTLGPAVGCIVEQYVREGRVTLLPWQLNIASQKEIRTEGLFAALNDCLYRSMYKYSLVALIDLDEYIMPKHNDTIPQLIKWMGTRLNTRNTGSYSFQNAFFYLQWSDDPSIYKTSDRTEASLMTLRKTRRRSKLHPHKQRSKYICRPEQVVEAGNHFVWEFVPGHGTLNVPADAAILHHYRVCEFGGDDCIKTTSTIDRTAYKFRSKLIKMVNNKYEELKQKCSLPNLPPVPTKPPTVKPHPKPVFKNTAQKYDSKSSIRYSGQKKKS